MNAFFIIFAAAVLAFFPIPAVQAVLATAASTLFESTPFILAGVLLAGVAPRRGAKLAALLGCGCAGGPGALALPVFASSILSLGPVVALVRWIGAFAVSRMRQRAFAHAHPAAGSELFALLPYAIASGVLVGAVPAQLASNVHPLITAVGVAALCFIASPCGLGSIALAVTLQRTAPLAAMAVLCVAGICDLRALRPARANVHLHDGFAYATAALACLLLAWHRGNTLVNPRFAIALYCSGAVLAWLACRYRNAREPKARLAPALMLLMSILSAPPPMYYANETTLAEAFAGESLTFRGALATTGSRTSIVRYEVACCRADAQPVSVRLTSRLQEERGQWILARGRLVRSDAGLALHVVHYERIAAPADPFLYR